MSEYIIEITPHFEKQIKKIKKKDKVMFDRLIKKIKEIQNQPEHYKPLRNVLKGTRRVHLDPFVIIFEINDNVIIFHYVKHHDKAY